MLDTTELKRRMDAARTLKGLTQVELADLVHSDGLGKHDVGRLERGAIPLSRALKDSMSRHLAVPPEWFTEPDFSQVLEPEQSQLDRLEEKLDGGIVEQQDLRDQIAQQNRNLGQQTEILAELKGIAQGIAELVGREAQVLARIEELVGVLKDAEIIEQRADEPDLTDATVPDVPLEVDEPVPDRPRRAG